mmetsp:Transcript_9600/g.28663  ORF Transcript_9600/g.28663 Transcript_9600/m.28663 type:complete len:212 (-) Transcript_9600:201-836(-)
MFWIFQDRGLIHFFERSVESILSVHVLPILPGLVLGSSSPSCSRLVVFYRLSLGGSKPIESQQLLHLFFFVQPLEFLRTNLDDSLLWLFFVPCPLVGTAACLFFSCLVLVQSRQCFVFFFQLFSQTRHSLLPLPGKLPMAIHDFSVAVGFLVSFVVTPIVLLFLTVSAIRLSTSLSVSFHVVRTMMISIVTGCVRTAAHDDVLFVQECRSC